jgi:hypothetical protein
VGNCIDCTILWDTVLIGYMVGNCIDFAILWNAVLTALYGGTLY